jgi:hypothetical protein
MDPLSSPETHNARRQALDIVKSSPQSPRTRQHSDRPELLMVSHTFDRLSVTEQAKKKLAKHKPLLSLFCLSKDFKNPTNAYTAHFDHILFDLSDKDATPSNEFRYLLSVGDFYKKSDVFFPATKLAS